MTEASLLKYFEGISDSRVERSKLHPLSSVLILTLCAVVSGIESFTGVQMYGELREDWLKKFIELPNGIPSHDTIGRVFARLNPTATADYMLAFKGNQPTLEAAVTNTFAQALSDPCFVSATNFHETHDKGHVREEVRRCWVIDVGQECGAPFDESTNLNAIALVESERTTGKGTSTHSRYYIISKPGISAQEALAASRSHWGIENKLHWVLDVAFREDDCRVRVGYAAQNFAVIRHTALNLLRAAEDVYQKKLSIKNKRMVAIYDKNYLLHTLGLKLLKN